MFSPETPIEVVDGDLQQDHFSKMNHPRGVLRLGDSKTQAFPSLAGQSSH